MNRILPLKPLAAAVLVALPTLAHAQALEEVIVTAQKRVQSLAEVPISVAAVSGATIENRGIESLASLSSSVPNVFISESQIDSTIQIRGVQTGANKGFEQSVAMYVDGIYYGRSQLIRLPLIDLDRVEVLRGPQPTLFGKNAIAGGVSVWSAKPTDEFEGKVTASYEWEHEETHLTGMVSGPITDTVSGRLVASWRDLDGFFTNQVTGNTEAGREETFVRGTLSWDTTENLSMSLKGEYADFEREGWALELHSPQDSFETVYQGPFFVETKENYKNESGPSDSQNEVTNLVYNLEYQWGEHTITAITGWVEYETEELIDVDYSRLVLLDNTNQGEDYEQFSQEIRLTSPGGEFIDYIAGVYYHDSELTVTDEIFYGETFLITPFAPIADSYTDRLYTQDAELWSVFAQFDIHFTDDLTLTIGGRYNDESKEGRRQLDIVAGPTNSGVNVPMPPPYDNLLNFFYAQLNQWAHVVESDRDEDSFDPLVNLQYQFNDDIMGYISYAEGSKAGGFDVRGNSLPGHPVAVPGTWEFEDESATNYEVGAKFFFERAELSVAAFHTEYDDLQTQIFDGTLNFLVLNASESTIEGIEMDGRYLVTDGLTMYGALGWVDFEYDSFENAQCAYPMGGTSCSLTGETNNLTPEWSANLGLDYERPLGDSMLFDANLNLDYTDEYYGMANLDENSIQDSYTKVGAVLGLGSADGTWRVSLIGDNLTDERIRLQTGSMPLSTTFTGGAGIAYDSLYARPRNYTLKLEYNF